jgi:endonuclease/exonuclease/phosphatase family metal-dependent hydrolase
MPLLSQGGSGDSVVRAFSYFLICIFAHYLSSMAVRYRRYTKIIFLIVHICVAILFLLACLSPYLDPKKWWIISLIGLGFAFLIVTLIAFIFFWLVFKPQFILVSILPMLIGWKSISVFFAFHIPEKFDYEKKNPTLRIVSWNVARFTEWKKNNNKGSRTRQKMMDLLKEQNADVLCLQEFFTSTDPAFYNNLSYVMKEMGYPYYYFSWDNDTYLQWVGQVIFSRLPIVDSGMIRFPRPSMPEALIHTDLLFNKDTIRLYTTQLQSVQFRKQDFESIEKIKNTDDGMVENSKNIFSKLKKGVINRSRQASIVKDLISHSPHPYILTGDFNDVPNSYAYFTIRDNDLQDAFLVSGFGVGKTFSNIAPTLRIDYIFTTRDFAVRQFNRVIKNYSDHYMLVADLQLKAH